MRERGDRVPAIAHAELQAVVAAQRVGQEIRAVSLEFGRRTDRLVRCAKRTALVAGGLDRLWLDVEHAVRLGRLRVGGKLLRSCIPRGAAVALRVLVIQV